MQTFLKNGYIVSMDQNDTVFDGGGVLVENDRITAVGRVDPAKISPDAEVIDLRGKYVLPAASATMWILSAGCTRECGPLRAI